MKSIQNTSMFHKNKPLFKRLWVNNIFKKFSKQVSVHQGCIYLMKNTVKKSNIFEIFLQLTGSL